MNQAPYCKWILVDFMVIVTRWITIYSFIFEFSHNITCLLPNRIVRIKLLAYCLQFSTGWIDWCDYVLKYYNKSNLHTRLKSVPVLDSLPSSKNVLHIWLNLYIVRIISSTHYYSTHYNVSKTYTYLSLELFNSRMLIVLLGKLS